MTTPNTLVIGATRSGKSTTVMAEDFIPTVDSGECCVVVEDPHADFGEKAAQWVSYYYPERLLVEYLGNISHVLSWGFLRRSRAENPVVRESENRANASIFADILAVQQGTDLHGAPLKKEWIRAALLLWLFQRTDVPLLRLPWAFKPGSNFFHEMVEGCEDEEIAFKFRMLEKFNSAVALYNAVGPAARLLDELFMEMPFKLRTEPTFDLDTFIREKGILIVMGGGETSISHDSVRVLLRSLTHPFIEAVSQNWQRTGTPLPVKLYIDEAANFSLVGKPEALALGQTTKMGMTMTVMSQAPDFGDEAINRSIDQNCGRKIYHRCGNAEIAKQVAQALKTTLNPNREKQRHVTKRQRHAGFIEEERRTTGTWTSGETEGVSENVNIVNVPIYEDFTEERIDLMPLSEQNELNEAAILSMPVGECFQSNDGLVVRRRVTPAEDPWTFPGYGKEKLTELIEHYRNLGVYSKIDPEAWKPAPPPEAKAPTGKGGRGMRKSSEQPRKGR